MTPHASGGENALLDSAERKIRIAIARKDDEPGPWAVLGELNYRRSAFRESVSALERADSLYEQRGTPVSARALSWLALAYHGAGDHDRARQTLRSRRDGYGRSERAGGGRASH
jgi:uncharacterized protein HemY